MKCPICGGSVYRHQLSRRMQEVAQYPRPSIRGTPEDKEETARLAASFPPSVFQAFAYIEHAALWIYFKFFDKLFPK